MLSAFKSDFYLMKSTIRFFLIVQVFMICFAIVNSSQYLYLFYPTFMSLVLMTSINGSAQLSGFSSILLSSPISRKDIVIGRYLFILGFSIPVILLSSAVMFILRDATVYEAIRLIIICCTIIITLQAIFSPLTYILKPNYISLVFFSVWFIPAIIVMLLKPLLERSNFNIENIILTIENIYNSLTTLSIILLVSLILLAISMTISIAVFKKKEF